MSECRWLRHPEYPDLKILVCRSRLGWFIKDKNYATAKEVAYYFDWCAAIKKDPYVS